MIFDDGPTAGLVQQQNYKSQLENFMNEFK